MKADRQAIRARCEATSPGPWDTGGVIDVGYVFRCPAPSEGGVFKVQDNREFIAHAREDVPALLDEAGERDVVIREVVGEINGAVVTEGERLRPILQAWAKRLNALLEE